MPWDDIKRKLVRRIGWYEKNWSSSLNTAPSALATLLQNFLDKALKRTAYCKARQIVVWSTPKSAAIFPMVSSPLSNIFRACLICWGVRGFGRPGYFPRRLAAASPALVRSTIKDCSNSANAPMIWKTSFLPAVVLIPSDKLWNPAPFSLTFQSVQLNARGSDLVDRISTRLRHRHFLFI